MNALDSGLHYEVASSSRKRCNFSGVRQIVQNSTFCGNNGRNIGRRIGKVILGLHMEVARITRKYCVRLRASIHSGFDKRVEQDVRDKDKVVNSVPLIDRWANRIYELEVGAVFEVFCRK